MLADQAIVLMARTAGADPPPRRVQLQENLVRAVACALSLAEETEASYQAAHQAYRKVAEVLVELRHDFTTSDGRTPDLRGRSAGYRNLVRLAYTQAGATGGGPIEKRLTAGVSYWVRKILLERYSAAKLHAMGVISQRPDRSGTSRLRELQRGDPGECLATAVELLNMLASDPSFVPGEHILRSAARAVVLLQHKVSARTGAT